MKDKEITKKKTHLRSQTVPLTLRLPTDGLKKELLENWTDLCRRILRLIAISVGPIAEKEKLANFFLLIMNVIDIEHEKISYTEIRSKASTRGRGAL